MIIPSYYTRTPGHEVRTVSCLVGDHVEGISMLLPLVRCAPNDPIERYFDAKYVCCVDDVMHELEGKNDSAREFHQNGGRIVDRVTVKETDILVVKTRKEDE